MLLTWIRELNIAVEQKIQQAPQSLIDEVESVLNGTFRGYGSDDEYG